MYFAKLAISMYSRQGSVDRLLKTPFDHISKHLEDRQKYFAARRIFTYLLDVWKLWPNSNVLIIIKGLRRKIICCIQDIELALATGNGHDREKNDKKTVYCLWYFNHDRKSLLGI